MSHARPHDGTRSGAIFAALVRDIFPDLQHGGFYRALLEAAAGEQFGPTFVARAVRRFKNWRHGVPIELLAERLDFPWPSAPFVPDGWIIQADRSRVLCVEIEDSCPMSPRRLGVYAALWFVLDAELMWDLNLVTCDRWGNPRSIELAEVWCDQLEFA